MLGEGGEEGKLEPGKSTAFAILEVGVMMLVKVVPVIMLMTPQVCLCVVVRYHPSVSPRAAQSSSVLAMQARSRCRQDLLVLKIIFVLPGHAPAGAAA